MQTNPLTMQGIQAFSGSFNCHTMNDLAAHERYMRLALAEARKALQTKESPVGAVIVHEDRIIARAHNQKELLRDPTAHAEILALTQAATALDRWRLTGTTMYVTLEPCPMCAGALIQSRVDTVVFGADDPKAGAAGSTLNILEFPGYNHHPKVIRGVLAQECGELLTEFFRSLRESSSD